ncbi:MAG: hypothetical protein P4L45_07990, partial [Ignavibacteriaceae bacterium]|nr:hypothetical protein [Ignavibacteriaceae bacterium]
MKKIELLLLCGLINISLIAQSSNNQLFQSISGNLKDPSFFINTNYFHTNSLLFELHDSTSSNICLSDYSTGIDSFLTPVLLTNNNYQNINPVGIWVGDKKIVFFQTNSSGNWNIAYREYLNGTWGDAKVISDPTGNDISLSVIKYKIYYYYGNLPVGIVYQKNNSIYIFTKNDSVESNREVIQGSDSLKYSAPSAMYDDVYYSNEWNYPAIRITAIQTDNLQNERIIEKDISLSSNIDTTFIVDEGDVN